jgi:hypothetical protein
MMPSHALHILLQLSLDFQNLDLDKVQLFFDVGPSFDHSGTSSQSSRHTATFQSSCQKTVVDRDANEARPNSYQDMPVAFLGGPSLLGQ